MRQETDYKGIIRYYNELGQLHREDGPAIIYPEHIGGESYWYKGKLHRVDGPAIKNSDGINAWYKNGKLHREDGPAIITPKGQTAHYINGKYYTEEEFKIITFSLGQSK